jgi:glycosyltransferase involved in cell wall biosynthesis
VWLASVRRGIGVYFVQDIETSYYPDDRRTRDAVLATYRPEFRYLTTSPWNRDQLAGMGLSATIVAPGVDRSTYRALELERRDDVLVAVGRSHHLKNLELTIAAWRGLPEPRPELWLFGIEPEVAPEDGSRYFNRPTDAEVNELLNRATAFVQTSRHEGFCLPLLEAMSAGTPAVCTDAHGNVGFCHDGENCLMADGTPADVTAKLRALLSDRALRERLRMGGLATAAQLDWQRAGDELDAFYRSVAGRVAADQSSSATPPIER